MANGSKNGLSRPRLEYRRARLQIFRLRQALTPYQTFNLVGTTLLIRPLERTTRWYVHQHLGAMPQEFLPPTGRYIATVILAVGLAQDCSYAYWFANRLARSYSCRVVVLRSLGNGNVETSGQAFQFFHRVAWQNVGWIGPLLQQDAANDIPIMSVGFSKGGMDVTVLAKELIERFGIVIEDIFTLSTPWQGSRLWKKSLHPGAEFYKPGNSALMEMEELGQDLRRDWGIRFHFYCALGLDLIVHRSDARFRRPPEDHGISLVELKTRWYYARPLWLQFGHTALFNGLVYHQIGRAIHDQLRLRSAQDPATRLERYTAAQAFDRSFQDEETRDE